MIFTNVILTVKDSTDIATVRTLLAEQRRRSLEEPGCERFEVYQSEAQEELFILVERWASAEHLEAHRQAPAFVELYLPKVIPLVERTPHPCQLVE